MAHFDAGKFLSGEITSQAVDKLTKKEFLAVAKKLDATLQVEGKQKAEIKVIVIDYLIEKGKLPEGVKKEKVGQMTEFEFQLEMKRLETHEREREEREREEENIKSLKREREKEKSRESLRKGKEKRKDCLS